MNMKFAAGVLLAGMLIAGVAVYLTQAPKATEAPPVPAGVAPAMAATAAVAEKIDFSLADLEGTQRRVSEWDGKVRLINFWATWCAPCRREIPLLKRTQDAANNLQVIGIAVEDAEPVVAYAAAEPFNYPILVGQDEAIAAAEESGIPFIGLPFTIVLAPGGELLGSRMGEIHETHIERILGVAAKLDGGELDVAGARDALADL